MLLLLIASTLPTASRAADASRLKSEPAFYIETYGEVQPESDAEVARAHRVFEAVRAVADKNSRRLPKLIVVRSKTDPWAIALPSGHVVLSREAVAICHRGATPAAAESRLAFVLGHELAHLAHEDFWHQEVYAFLAERSGTQALAQLTRSEESSQNQELKADDKGFVYASIAGFPMQALLEQDKSAQDFFNYWLSQTSARAQTAHLAANVRAERHRQRLRDLNSQLAFFHFGVRLSHFDYCDDAVYFFREFQKTYPGREVLNNLGFCHLQMARQAMKPAHAYFYWMPDLLDGELRSGGSAGTRGEPSLKTLRQAGLGDAENYLKDAVDYLQRAAQADPGYLPARMNLAIAYLYLGQPHQARAVLEEAKSISPNEPNLDMLEALTLYEQSDSGLDLWPNAIAKLEKLAALPDARPEAIFNLARLSAIRPRPAEAQDQWNRLAGSASALPAAIKSIICENQTAQARDSCMKVEKHSAQPLPWNPPLSADSHQRIDKSSIGSWKVIGFDWVTDKLHGNIYFSPDGKSEILDLDGFTQMQTLVGDDLGAVADLPRYCPTPLRRRELAHGNVWSCDHWAAKAANDRISEVWWVGR